MRRLKSIFKFLLITFAVLLMTLAGLMSWALVYPEKALTLAQKYLLPADLNLTWEGVHFSAKHSSWQNWDIEWAAKKLDVEKKNPNLRVPVRDASVQFALRAFAKGPWVSFKEVKANLEEVSYQAGPDSAADQGKQSPFEQLESYLNYLRLGGRWLTLQSLDIRVAKFILRNANGEPSVVVAAKFQKPVKEEGALGYELHLEVGAHKIAAHGWVDANQLSGPAPFFSLIAEGSGAGGQMTSRITGNVVDQGVRFAGGGEIVAGQKKIKAIPQFTLNMNANEAFLRVTGELQNVPGPLVKLNGLEFELHQPFDKGFAWSQRPATFQLRGPVELFFIDKDMRPPLEKSCRCKIPEKLMVTYDGRVWFPPLLGQPARPTTVVESKLSVESVQNKLLSVNLNARLKVNKQGDEFLLEPSLDSDAAINSFQGLRQFLDARNVMIPAPLDILDGTITMSAKGAVDHDDKIIRATTDVVFKLASSNQKVFLDSTLRFDLARDLSSLSILVQVLVRDVRIELPPIDPLRGLPSLKTDSRLVMRPPAPPKNSGFKLRVSFDVKTESPGALKLLSKLAVPYAPVTLDVNTNAKGESAGSIRLEPFKITYLRRTVNVERLQVNLSENEDGDFPIGGRFRLDQTAYKIFVDLAGTAEAPIVNLNSEPYLERNDIISVLLFDRVSDQLVSADADTAGSVNAAMADRAIGLFGLWAFATTPIRSFSYNAVTKVYTATVQLADGLTAGVGTNWERAANLEVRKRVSRRWVLTASWSPAENKEQVGKLVLQWEKRF